ncbi:MAG: hypothetical protein ILO42_01060, partial [Clostridia bacterium]|nr:hypothetical protein [Clostridia bacterium]
MSRVHWNYCETDRVFPEPDQAIRFVYTPNMTLTSAFAGFSEPAPGSFPDDRVPPVKTVSLSKREGKRRLAEDRKEASREKRRAKERLTALEGAALAAAAAAAAVTAVVSLLKKKK